MRVLERVLGHAGVVDGLLQVLDFRGGVVVLAELLLDLAHLLAQHVLALAFVELLAGLVADLLGEPQHLHALAQDRQHLVQAAPEVEGFEHGLLFLVLDVEQVGHHVGEQRGESIACTTPASSSGTFGSSWMASAARLQLQEARLDFRRAISRRFENRHARHQERPALEELEHAEARLALHHQVVGAAG